MASQIPTPAAVGCLCVLVVLELITAPLAPAQETGFFPSVTTAERVAPAVVDVYLDAPVTRAPMSPSAFAVDAGLAPSSVEVKGDGKRVRLTFDAPVEASDLSIRDARPLPDGSHATRELPIADPPAPGEVVITEIMYQPLSASDGGAPQTEYFEVLNRTSRTLSLRGAFWTDAPDAHGEADTTRLGDRPLTLAPNGYAVVFAAPDGTPDPARDSRLARAFPEIDFTASSIILAPIPSHRIGLLVQGNLVRLHRSDGTPLTETHYDPDWHDPNLPTPRGVALERIDTARDSNTPLDWASSAHPSGGTPGMANSIASDPTARPPDPDELTLNEILFDPLADPDRPHPKQVEYIELFNRTGDRLELNGLLYTDQPNDQGVADTLRVAHGPTVVAPGGFAVIFAAPDRPPDPAMSSRLAAAFPETNFASPNVTLLPLPRQRLGLRNTGDRVRIQRADGTVLTDVRYAPSWHAHGLATTKGTALERISLDAPTEAASNWTSSVDSAGGTPGRPNSVSFGYQDSSSLGLTVEPSPFAPDGNGRNATTEIRYVLPDDVALARVRIFDAMGRLVRTLEEAALVSREGAFTWDGRDDNGRSLRIGIYVVLLETVDAEGGNTRSYKDSVVLAQPL